jgi:hypothetical protein
MIELGGVPSSAPSTSSPSPSQGPVSLPDSLPASPPAPGSEEAINAGRHVALEQLARDEDIADYAAERRDQVEVIDEGRELPEDRRRSWYRRASKALNDAAMEASGLEPRRELDASVTQFNPTDQQYDPSQDPVYARKAGIVTEKINQFFGDNRNRRQEIVDWGSAMDERGEVADWVIRNECAVAPQMFERLVSHPQAWAEIAQMDPQTRDRTLSKLEGAIEAEMRFANQQQAQAQQWQEQAARKVTRAPPPISRMPTGGALPPSDIHQLAARSDDATAHVRQRMQMERGTK